MLQHQVPGDISELNFVIAGDMGVGKKSLVHKFHEILKSTDMRPHELVHFIDKKKKIERFSMPSCYYCLSKTTRIIKLPKLNFFLPFAPTSSSGHDHKKNYPQKGSIHGAIFIFDLANIQSLQYIKSLLKELWQENRLRTKHIIIVGNKYDLFRPTDPHYMAMCQQSFDKMRIPASYCQASATSGKNAIIGNAYIDMYLRSFTLMDLQTSYCQTSALDGTNVKSAFEQLIHKHFYSTQYPQVQ